VLTPKQITEVETIYICRNYNTINDDLFVVFIEHFYDANLEPFMDFKWLLNRWPLLRKHKNQMPTRIVYIYNHLPSSSFK
jgi:hypothetical protein